MRVSRILLISGSFALGCTVSEEPRPVSHSHPASPFATTAALPRLDNVLGPPPGDSGSDQTIGRSRHIPDSSTARSYVCPMHTEVTSDKPGRCPKCGMRLVPNTRGDHDAH